MSSIQLSAQYYTTEIQKVRELVAVAQRVPGLESEIKALDAEVSRMTKIIAADSVVKRTQIQMNEAITREKDAYKGLYETQVKLTKAENKEKKKWKRRTIGSVIVGFGILILSLNQ